MSISYFANGAFGVVLGEHGERLGPVYGELAAAVAERIDEDGLEPHEEREDGDGEGDDLTEAVYEIGERFVAKLTEAFARAGIVVPPGVHVLYTGGDGSHPGECNVGEGELILGFGVLTKPWDYPPVDESFRAVADLHTWVTYS